MAEIQSHHDLIVWQKAIELVVAVYGVSAEFPDSERFGLTTQLRRAAVSVPSNIAEGYGRGSQQDYLRFLRIARGSLFEMDTQLLLSARLGFLPEAKHAELRGQCKECGRILAGLIRSVESSTSPGPQT